MTTRLNQLLLLTVIIILSYFAAYEIWRDLIALTIPTGQIRDVVQDYLSSRHLLNGQNPYISIEDLRMLYAPFDQTPTFYHPTPHTPFSLFIFSLLGFQTLEQAQTIWYFAQLTILIGCFWYLSGKIDGVGSSLAYRCVFVAVMLGADPVRMELILGQWNFLLMLLITLYTFPFAHCNKWKSIIVGLTCSLKSCGFAQIIFYSFTRNIKALCISTITIFCMTGLTLFLFDWSWIWNYFSHVAPTLSQFYLQETANCSFAASLASLIAITGAKEVAYQSILPFFLVLLCVIYFSKQAMSLKDAPGKECYLWVVSLLMLPIAWTHCLIILVPCAIKLIQGVHFKNLSLSFQLASIALIFCWYFARQPGLFLMGVLENYPDRIATAFSIVGIWLPLYLICALIFLKKMDPTLSNRQASL